MRNEDIQCILQVASTRLCAVAVFVGLDVSID